MSEDEAFKKLSEIVHNIYDKYFIAVRDTIIDNDDVINLKIQIGLYGDNSKEFIESLPITRKQ